MPTNEEYLELWEQSAPELVDSWTPEQKAAALAKPLQEAPWDTYDKEMAGEYNDAALNAAIEEYSQRVSDAAPTAQTEDELLRLQENNERSAKEYQWLTPAEYADAGDRIGKVKGVATFIRQLQKGGLQCWYRNHPHKDKLTLIAIHPETKDAQVACWVAFGYMPELSVMRFNDHGIPTTEKYRGWRTGVLQMILKGFITEQKAVDIFGKVPTTKAFDRYNLTLQSFRNQGRKLVK